MVTKIGRLDEEAKRGPVPKNSSLGKFLVKTIEQERSFMDDCCDGDETDRHLWSRRVLSGEVAVDDMIQYFKRYYSEDEAEFIERLESAASADGLVTESLYESVGYDVSGTTPTGAGDYNIDEERGITSPEKAIELWFKIEAKHPLNTDISAYKKDDAIALITWAYENQNKIAEWYKKYRCPYKLEFMLAAIKRQYNNGCRSFHENEFGEMIDPFCIG